ncbi:MULTISPECIES: type 4a pilus biogenesis protein PilO [unclassified Shewanella]|uniref:type 4a pilus biogenesis protein PilO n=1 Tax=unclassified Shewanella TaxID=196818 RepID=UPI000970E555|nr:MULTISPECIES: type 4a pilus biogenesis protein PilO [unclassified Shewanella]MDO6620030.1 type 4a pilus biogenesis protein PilO [Shewanella sp. 6_MG-2023]MDO6640220.1 type 4a pilus biogenesis protein PilO [Shewanella sp. 5_MG-2023]MDO6679351.1 type 4a pilus biogenesis protein PilO [Shewanella sp. 4_MG-2023]MDO6777355.1 type 4a pilus biogenesis protein PilO [Shewanella sp. 3_MG-2023]PMG31017.1 pilus assembly protein PilP [Shewanella sp. 10N.286.52.C2]
MNLDLEQFNDIDFENIGAWPALVKIVFAAFLSICVLGASYYLFISDAIDVLNAEERKEITLKEDFQTKYRLAANLKLYREQLVVMEAQFAELLKMLPSENEMPGLLDDTTFVATDAGLRINSLDWDTEIERDFYLEFPIKMSVVGDYHKLGSMVSGVAKLPRIVSLHDFVIKRDDSGSLSMDILAKTYRFKEGAKVPANKKGKK